MVHGQMSWGCLTLLGLPQAWAR
uniref:Uncharacterized protein n=1 Tax=Anguilla anguilla TaxID=7936 RepID=A0A0E9TVA4_ANGAN